MPDLGSLQALENWINQFYTANNQQRITGPIGNTGLQNVKDTLAGIINSKFAGVSPMIDASSTALKGGVPVEGNTLAKLYNLILALETTDFKDTYALMTAAVYESNKLIVVKNAADGPDVASGAALYFYNSSTFEFLAGYDTINFQAEPAGADREIQFNNAGAAGADANLKWDDVLGLLLGANKPLSLHGGAIQLVPATVETKNLLRILIDEVEIARLSTEAFELLGGQAVAAPRVQHPATDDKPLFTTNAEPNTGLGFIFNITEAKWILAFYVAGVKAFEIHDSYLLLPDGSRIGTGNNVVEIVPPDNKIKALTIGKADNRFNSISILVGDAENGEAGILIDYNGLSYSADLSALNANNENWLTSKKYVDIADANKVDKVAGKGLSSNDYTLEEKTKLASLSQLFLGKYATKAALDAAYPAASPGQYADVDPGAGEPVKRYNWDDQEGWVIGTAEGTISTTDELPEGAANKYFTEARTLAAALGDLTGSIVNGTITDADTIKAAIGKLQGQVNNKADASAISGAGIKFWTDIADGATINAGQSINYNNILYFCKQTHQVGTPKTFNPIKYNVEGTTQLPYSTSIPFTTILGIMPDANITADTTFTPDPAGAVKGSRVQLRITYGSVGKTILFTGFKQTADSCPIYSVVGAAQLIDFRFDGTDFWVKVSNENTNLALKTDVLVKGSATPFTPTLDNDPTPKKWVEDKIVERIANYYPGIPTGGGVDLGYYGIQWNENYPNSGCKRTGTLAGYVGGGYYNEFGYPLSYRPNSNIPEQFLFVHNKIKRCMLKDDGTVNYYLDSSNSYNKQDVAPSVNGTTTGTAANKIICTGLFTGLASDYIGKFVHNTTSGKINRYALITAKDTDDQLSIDCGVNNVASATFFDTGDTFEICTAILDGTDGQIMVEIPKFFIRFGYSNGINTLDISLYPYEGFAIHPAFVEGVTTKDFIYYSAFEAFDLTNKLTSIPLKVPTVNITRASFRTKASNRGANWRQEAFWYRSAVQTLFFVEFADLNSQYRLPGYTEIKSFVSSYVRKTGRTLQYGNMNGTVYADSTYDNDIVADANWNEHQAVANSYRGIENLYGNVWKFLDGINIYDRNIYVTNNLGVFADDTGNGYDNLNMALPTTGYIKTVYPVAGAYLPKLSGGSSSTYFTDQVYTDTGWRVGISGGALTNGATAGVACLSAYSASSYASALLGARLCF